VALGTSLIQETKSIESANKVLSEYVPYDGLERVSDVNLQINSPFKSQTLEGLNINCVTRWSSGIAVRFQIMNGMAAQQPLNNVSIARLDADLNSPAEFPGIISKDSFEKLFAEMMDRVLELADKGMKR